LIYTHSIASGHAFNTVYEIAKTARDKGLEMIGITDHGPAILGGPTKIYFYATRRVPKKLFGVEVVMGCEANILDTDGLLDLPKEMLSLQTIVLAGLHMPTSYTGKTKEDNTKAIIGAIENPFVHAISHPYDPHFFPTDIGEVVGAASEFDVALEINCSRLIKFEKSKEFIEETISMIKQAQDKGVKMFISSDAHIVSEIGDDSIIDELNMRKVIKEECLLNISTHKVKKFLEKKNRARPKVDL
jgi:putative hydrolase